MGMGFKVVIRTMNTDVLNLSVKMFVPSVAISVEIHHINNHGTG